LPLRRRGAAGPSADLNQILRVEKRIAGEKGIANGFRVRIERAIFCQRLALEVPFGRLAMGRLARESV
jgi:hypothetical protein